jgi:hypothetical protein
LSAYHPWSDELTFMMPRTRATADTLVSLFNIQGEELTTVDTKKIKNNMYVHTSVKEQEHSAVMSRPHSIAIALQGEHLARLALLHCGHVHG